MKIKTSEATPLQLNWLVAQCEGLKPCAVFGKGSVMGAGFALPTRYGHEPVLLRHVHDSWCKKCDDYPWSKNQVIWEPTCNWSQGGPIIESGANNLFKHNGGTEWCCACNVPRDGYTAIVTADGPTPLIAATRCFVASRLGNEIDIPEDLLT